MSHAKHFNFAHQDLNMSRYSIICLGIVPVVLTGIFALNAAEEKPLLTSEQAAKLYNDGHYQEAYEAFQARALNAENDGPQLVYDIQFTFHSLGRLKKRQVLDQFLDELLEVHEENFWALWEAANRLRTTSHYGYLVDNEFQRGHHRGGGQYVNTTDRDRVQSLRWYVSAMQNMPENLPADKVTQFYRDFSLAMTMDRMGTAAWKLQVLTDLEELPDLEEVNYSYGGYGRSQGAPVDEDGNPIYYDIPESFAAAKNDGERWRWLLEQRAKVSDEQRHQTEFEFAQFAESQFGVRSVAGYGFDSFSSDEETSANIWALPSLSDEETIAKLASGIKRFKLREDYQFVKTFKRLATLKESPGSSAAQQLAGCYENRQQYPQAAEVWQETIKRHGDSRSQHKQKRLDQIVKNWGLFEPIVSQPAGAGATVDYRFRNGNSVSFTAYELKVSQLLNDVKAYLRARPRQPNWQKLQIDNIGYRIVERNEEKYIGDKVANWTLDLDPRENHFDRRVTVTTPLQKAGAYLLVSQMADGNTSRIIIWLNNTAIVKKPVDGKPTYFVADAVTGEPLPGMQLDFFGWQQRRIPETKRDYQVVVKEYADFSDRSGFLAVSDKLVPNNFQWLITTKDRTGRFAYLGFHHVWYQDHHDQTYQQRKAYAVTDRPVYRPEQTVKFKFWMREAKYDKLHDSIFALQPFDIKVVDARGNDIYKARFDTDEFGGLNGEFTLPEDAKLGQYHLYVEGHGRIHGGVHFRVEEYKKPEFEVLVETPQQPVSLGEKFEATIHAKYYYGAPVTNAKVKLRVERSNYDASWYPVTRWDWLYGNGYWWFAPNYDWYPGFNHWGCFAPRPSWQHWNPDPPELIIDREVEIDEDGKIEFEIDSEIAKVLHGDHDQQYKITAEVTDASRRTIVGTGSILVPREPFQIFSWTDQGHYRVGETITASFQARTIAGKGVEGEGKLKLMKVEYKDGEPQETVVEEWDLNTDAEGAAEQKIIANQAGQYRLSYSVTVNEHTVEGGYLFVIRGDGFDGSDYRFTDLELLTDKKTYQPGETVELLINTDRRDSTVLLFLRAVNGNYPALPQVIRMQGKSKVVEIPVTETDYPNFYLEALTISEGKVHTAVQQIAVPPAEKVINMEVVADETEYLPGAEAKLQLKLTDAAGNPFAGSTLLSVYDRAVEYISGGSNIAAIRQFYWGWKRNHSPNTEHNLERYFQQLLKRGETAMAHIGVFGHEVADREEEMVMEGAGFGGGWVGGGGGFGGMVGEAKQMRGGALPAPASALSLDAGVMDELSVVSQQAGGAADFAEATVRENFADTAYWNAAVRTDENGLAEVSFKMPDSLTSWKIRAWGMGAGTEVGEATSEVVTAKNLIVRLQAPRFFVEKDEVVLSAVVHNYLETAKQAQVSLLLEGNCLDLIAGDDLQRSVNIPANGEVRVDWRVKAIAEGTAIVTMQALTDEESDAMKMEFPVFVHGMPKTESFSGVVRVEEKQGTIRFTVPEERRPAESRLEVRFSPTLAGAMVDALPYLVDYPYGCTEQTLNRFIPTVITQNILNEMNLDLAAIREKRTNLNAQQIGDPQERAAQWKRYERNPVFDEAQVELMVKKGVQDLTAMQNSDGGWGWFSGYGERSYPHTTAVVVHGLQLAGENKVAIVDGILERGLNWLKKHQLRQVDLLLEGERRKEEPGRKKPYKSQADNIDALLFSVLIDAGIANKEMQRFLYRDRLHLSLYAQALLGQSLHKVQALEERDMIVRNLDQFLKYDEENQTAFLDLPNQNYWWYWYGSGLEANAQFLKLLSQVRPADKRTAGLVKYLLNNRKHGTYWTNTRDTAYCIEALADYLRATDELNPKLTVEVWLDGELHKTVEIDQESLFSFDNTFVLEGADLTSGEHLLELKKTGTGPLYHNAYLSYFTLEDFITKTGLEIKVERRIYKLVQNQAATDLVSGQRGQSLNQKKLKYDRFPIEDGAELQSGDLVEIELVIDSKNDYEYVIFEDFKAAGLEPVNLQSGYTSGGLGAYVEFRDEKVAFFSRRLARGKHSMSYRLRAEIPGKFSALPTQAYAMYAPELKANADEAKITVTDSQ